MSRGPLRVPVDATELEPGLRALGAAAATYVTRVHRLRAGDRLVVFDPESGLEADAEIAEAGRRLVKIRVGAPRPAALRARRPVTLIQGVGKGDKMDSIVRDATELGATRIVPALCARGATRPDAARAARWRRIAVEAARQCGRGDAPAVSTIVGLIDALACEGDGTKLCLDPRAQLALGAALAPIGEDAVVLAVGPEGGFDHDELVAAERAGFLLVTLGPLTLRTETVCAAVLGALLALGR